MEHLLQFPSQGKLILTQSTDTSLIEYKTACGGVIKDPSNYPNAEYRGERVYFCTRACLRVFEQDPDAFMSGEREHPLEED
jgi:YHS domain-containing protein